MRQIVVLFFLVMCAGLFPVFAQSPAVRQTACDLCGYCPPNPVPGRWLDCKKCLYPSANDDPASGDTLRIVDPNSNLPPTPAPGKMYTQLGCIGTNLGGFQQEGAAGGVVQTLLNVVFSIVGGIGFLSIIYGSFIVMTSQASPERLNYGKKIIFGAVVGVIFSISAVFIVNLLATGILRIPGFGSISPTPAP